MYKTNADRIAAKVRKKQRGSEYLYYTAIGRERDQLLAAGWEQVGIVPVLFNGNSLYDKYTMRIKQSALTPAA